MLELAGHAHLVDRGILRPFEYRIQRTIGLAGRSGASFAHAAHARCTPSRHGHALLTSFARHRHPRLLRDVAEHAACRDVRQSLDHALLTHERRHAVQIHHGSVWPARGHKHVRLTRQLEAMTRPLRKNKANNKTSEPNATTKSSSHRACPLVLLVLHSPDVPRARL